MGAFDAFQNNGSMSPFEQQITRLLQNNPQGLGQNPSLAALLAQFTNGYRSGQAPAQGAPNPPPNPPANLSGQPPNPPASNYGGNASPLGMPGQANNNLATPLQGLLGMSGDAGSPQGSPSLSQGQPVIPGQFYDRRM